MQRNLARLGPYWQERERTWDERCGDYGPALPLLPLVCTAISSVGVVGMALLLSLLLGGCGELGMLGAKMHGFKVVEADECRHAFHTHPCKTVEPKP
jgi:hypothetical protein